MIYLIVQKDLDQPIVIPFASRNDMEDYRKNKLGSVFVVDIYDNVYYLHIKK